MSAGKKLSIMLVVALLAIVPAACGGDDDSASNGANGPTLQQQGGQGGQGDEGRQGGDGGEKRREAGGESEPDGSQGGEVPGDFEPREHEDSGGGSGQFRVKAGDNSIQDFGSEMGGGEFDRAAQVLHNFLDARAAGQWRAACAFLASSVRQSLEQFAQRARDAGTEEAGRTDCAAMLKNLTNPAAKGLLRKEANRADVGSIRVEGNRGFAIYRGLEGSIMAITLAKEDGSWKVASLAGTPLN